MTEYLDVVLIVPLEEELQEVLRVFTPLEDRCTATSFRYTVETGIAHIRMLVVQQSDMGKEYAQQSTSEILSEYDVGVIVCLGIAGALSTDLTLGDVCYTGGVLDVLERSKATDSRSQEGYEIAFSPTYYSTRREIAAAFNFVRTHPDLAPKYQGWRDSQSGLAAKLVSDPIPGRDGVPVMIKEPTSKNGTIVCGAVTTSADYRGKLLAIDRKLLAVETESGGIFAAAQAKNIPAVTIRGISDFADETKSQLETNSRSRVRQLAATNAATFFRLQIQNPWFQLFLAEAKEQRTHGQQTLLENFPIPSGDTSKLLRDLGNTIDERLRELCPEFKLLPRGYHLPLPRIRRVDDTGKLSAEEPAEPIEIRDSLQDRHRVLLNIPRNYPDQSLAWVIAEDLLTTEISGKQVLPIVIDGATIRPPKFGFQKYADRALKPLQTLPGTQLVFIVQNLPLESKTRLRFLIDEVNEYNDARFVFIDRSDESILRESEFSTTLSPSVYDICQVSFIEISHFLQKNFSMTDSESEVVALRLRETFTRFDLSAHPSYLAGIPQQTLSALLQANRRAELIQLAVDGFLTFLVADDKSDITLSRTTRSRFLRRLVVALNVDKTPIDEEGIISLTKSFAKEHDFEINPLLFIQSFVDKGLLHFEGGSVRLSLPFIESYLLASELHSDETRAIDYFRVGEPDFDLSTFDLYSEIGASPRMVQAILDRLEHYIGHIGSDSADNILLTDEIRPAVLANPRRIDTFRTQLARAFDEVRSNKDGKEEKQRFLDIADRVQESAARRASKSKKKSRQLDEADDRLSAAVQTWLAGTVLLGSGAEHLNAETKRALASLLVRLAARILDAWTRKQLSIDFDSVRTELTSEESIASVREQLADGGVDGIDTRRLVEDIVDVLEMSVLSDPLRRTIQHLCEQARHRVLAASLEATEVDGKIERLIRGSWLADINSTRGKSDLRRAIGDLPAALFLRVAFVTHFLTRVYWSHWKEEDRGALLDAADQLVRPLNLKLDKPRLKRIIQRVAED